MLAHVFSRPLNVLKVFCVLGVLAVSTAAVIPVHDAPNALLQRIQHMYTMAQLAKQLSQEVKQVQEAIRKYEYDRRMHGAWEAARMQLPSNITRMPLIGTINLTALGWESEFAKNPAASHLDQAMQATRQVLNGTDPQQFGSLNSSLGVLIGKAPVTEKGAVTEFVRQEVGSQMMLNSQINAAIAEKLRNIDFLRSRINSGTDTPGDLERDMVILASEQADLQLLQIRTQASTNRVNMVNLMLANRQSGDVERDRVAESQNRLALMGAAASFALAK